MVNHLRTLLLNKAASSRPKLGQFGEEHIPASYIPVSDIQASSDLRAVLFGSSADELTQNYRLAQYTGLLHADPLAAQYTVALDPRISYRSSGFIDAFFGHTITAIPGAADPPELIVTTPWAGHDDIGFNSRELRVTVDTDNLVFRIEQQRPRSLYTADYTFADEGTRCYSSIVAVSDDASDMAIQAWNTSAVSLDGGNEYEFIIQLAARPARSLETIAGQVLSHGHLLEALWQGSRNTEPMKTFRNLVEQGTSLQQRLIGVLLTLGYWTEQRRST